MRISDWSSDVCSSDLPGIQEIGDKLTRDRAREREMQAGLAILEHGTLVQKLWYLGQHADRELVRATWMAYTPGLPLSFDALLCGLFGDRKSTRLNSSH